MVCDAAEFEIRHLIEVLAPTLLSQDAGTLLITGVELLTPAQQKILQTLMTSRDVFLPFARRFRLVLAAAAHLSDLADAGSFDETLFYKISSLSVDVPALRELRGDILLHARQLLDQHAAASQSAKSPALTTEAALWLEAQDWTGNYTQLSRTLQVAVAGVTAGELDVSDLESAVEAVFAEAGLANPPAAPVASHSRAPIAVDETLPPFAMRAAPAPVPVAVAAPAAVPLSASAPAATKPAPARPSGLSARSIFRPASGVYDFSRRLAESLAVAEAAATS
jgi:DNA-binding NtrC family response regulator